MHGLPHVIVCQMACAIDVTGRMLIKLTSTCQLLRTHIHMEITCIWVYLTTESEWFPCVYVVSTLNTENCHDAIFVVTGGTGGCHDNHRCHQWRQSCHHDDTRFSVYVSKMKCTIIIIHCTCRTYFMHTLVIDKISPTHLYIMPIPEHNCHRTLSTIGHNLTNGSFINLNDNPEHGQHQELESIMKYGPTYPSTWLSLMDQYNLAICLAQVRYARRHLAICTDVKKLLAWGKRAVYRDHVDIVKNMDSVISWTKMVSLFGGSMYPVPFPSARHCNKFPTKPSIGCKAKVIMWDDSKGKKALCIWNYSLPHAICT